MNCKRPKKSSFKLRNEKNGSFLNFHNTTLDNGKLLRIRLINACFNHASTQLVTIDHRGNIFIIDFSIKKIWKTFDQCKRSTTIKHNPYKSNEYFVGTKNGEIFVVDTETGLITNSEKFCSLPIETISIPIYSGKIRFSESISSKYFLVSTSSEAILVDLKTFQPTYRLKFGNEDDDMNIISNQILLKFVAYFPNSDRILGCFSNNSIHIWSTQFPKSPKNAKQNYDDGAAGDVGNMMNSSNKNFEDSTETDMENQTSAENTIFTLKTIRILHPLKVRDRQLKVNKNDSSMQLKFADQIYNRNTKANDNVSEMLNSLNRNNFVKDFTKGLINSIDFSLDGNYMCLTTLDDYIILLSSITLEIVKIIQTKDISLQRCLCFEKSIFGLSEGIYSSNTVKTPNNMIAIGLTAQSDIILIDWNDLLIKTIILGGECTYKLDLSYNGKLLFAILKTGEIKIFETSVAINVLLTAQKTVEVVNKVSKSLPDNIAITDELKNILSKERLMPILHEFGSYSDKYRHLIWATLLELPSNKIPFTELLRKGFHPVVLKYDEEFPLKDSTILRNLKKITSCLIYWCKILAECDFLPKFVFPFLKIFSNNSILTFELIVTIIFNHCQLWFEFAPMEPINYLGLIENTLNHYDPELHKFYGDRKITTKHYAWPLLTTSFSEILDEQQWYQLWDNILTKDIEFMIFIVVAYQIIQRNIIMRLETNESIELFFHEQYIIDMPKLLKKSQQLMMNIPNDLNPRRYLKKFICLPKGFYPKFEKYPKEWIDLKNREVEAIQIENHILDQKIRNLEIEEIQMAKKLEEGLKNEETQRRLKELEKHYCAAIAREEDRIACQRKLVLMYQKETRNRRSKVLDLVLNSTNRKDINVYENKLDTLMRNIERTRLRDETDMMLADEDLKDHELNLLSELHDIKSNQIVENNKEIDINLNYKREDEYNRNKQKVEDGFNMTTNYHNFNEKNNNYNIKSRSRDVNSRLSNSRRASDTKAVIQNPMNENRLKKEFEKTNNVIRKTYGIQLNSDRNPVGTVDNKRKTKTNNKHNINYIDRIDGLLDEIQMEFESIVDPEKGSS